MIRIIPLCLLLCFAAFASDPVFTVVVVPDPQYLAESGSCASAASYKSLIQWAIDHRYDVIGGDMLNIKGFIGVGDSQDLADTILTVGETRMADAFDLAYAANMFVVHAAGNHDYHHNGSVAVDRSLIGHAWQAGGRWSPANVASKYGAGINLGDGFTATFGGVYADPTYPQGTANAYYFLNFGSRKVLAIAVEFFPRASILQWVSDLAAANPDREVWYTTHAFLDHYGNVSTRGTANGPGSYSLGVPPLSTSGVEQWDGTSSNIGLKTIGNLSLITGGHFLYLPPTVGWPWQQRTAVNSAGRTVQQLFSDWQYYDLSPATCTAVEDIAHLQLLVISPTTMKSYMVSTKNGKWVGASGVMGSSAPIQLFNQPFMPLSTPVPTPPIQTSPPPPPFLRCDLNMDGRLGISDVASALAQAMGSACSTGDLNGDGRCDLLDVQLVLTAAITGVCR